MAVSAAGARVFRNNRGMFYTMDGRKVRAGLEANGASDLIGFVPIIITPEMVGRKVAVFLALECKNESWKKPNKEHELVQQHFIEFVKENGGIASFINDKKDVDKILDLYKL